MFRYSANFCSNSLKRIAIKIRLVTFLGTLFFACTNPSSAQQDPAVDPNDLREHDHAAETLKVKESDRQLFAAAKGVLQLSKIEIDSQIDDLKIPAYLFAPLDARKNSHPALVWVYGGIHDRFGTNYFPFIKEATERGFVVIAPEYRGATGYGEEYFNAMDYGGYEVNDILSAANHLSESVSEVDSKRIGVIGWSHGGYISLLSVTREKNPFACAVAFVPVSNLVFRMAYKGPEYQKAFINQKRNGGLPHERRQVHIDRSPVYYVDKLKVPLHVQVATNDRDVEFVESEMLVNALRAKKPKLAEAVVLKDPANGHYFNRQVDLKTLTRRDTEDQIDSWNRTWKFLEEHLK